MIANYQQPGAAIDYTNPSGDTIKAGQVVSLTTRIGIAGTEIPAAAVGSLHVKGVFTMDKASGAIALGAAVLLQRIDRQDHHHCQQCSPRRLGHCRSKV